MDLTPDEMAAVKNRKPSKMVFGTDPAFMDVFCTLCPRAVAQIERLAERLQESETENQALRECSQQDDETISVLTAERDALKARVETQAVTIRSLHDRVAALTAESARLTSERDAVSVTSAEMMTAALTAQAIVEQVRKLPKQWSERLTAPNVHQCTRELSAAILPPSSERETPEQPS